MSLELALSNARSGLSHVNRQLAQSASNIANAATPGYTRKVVEGRATVAGTMPTGVRSLEAARAVDTALIARMNAARAATEAAGARAAILKGVEVAHGATGDSVADLTAALGNAFTALRNNPSDALLQSKVTGAARALTDRYGAVSAAIQEGRQDAQDAMVADVGVLNDSLRQVSSLTDQIVSLRTQGKSTAELEDRRDAAIASISGIMEVRAVEQADGGLALIAAGGLNLPLRSPDGPFAIAQATLGAQAYHGAGGTLPAVTLLGADVTARLGTGTLAAHAALRDRELPLAQAELDVSAANLAARFDAQGLTLFTGPGGAVPDPAAAYATGGWIGLAGTLRVNPAVAANPSLVRDGTRAVTGTPGGATGFVPNPAGGPAQFTTLIDRVLNHAMGKEVSAGNAWPGFATTGLGPGGDLTSTLRPGRGIGDHATALVSAQTAARAEAEEEAAASGDLLSSLGSRFSDESGVDMDKELAAMIALQTAYSANARLVSVVQGLYDTLFQAVR